ncbi:DUF397 domain-containing protein [Nocardia sp. NPDC005978]|uniref:DUF397 domain-containing protein n=1 Tax=Nocardia sp. NPDC005978 TaxID=3156725 RepID=UPI0033AAF96A
MSQPTRGSWYRSSRSEGANQCVEVCHEAGRTGVRDSKHAGGPELWFTGEQWDRFLHSEIWHR